MQDVIVSFHNRTAKRLCVTDVTGLLLACFVVTRLHSTYILCTFGLDLSRSVT